MQNNMMSINEKSRKFVFAVKRRQKVGVAGIRMRHDYSTSLLGLGGFGVGGLWQNHGTSPGGFLSAFLSSPLIPAVLISPPRSLHIRPQGLMELCGYGSEETPNSAEGVFLGGVMLHSGQSFPGTPEQPGSTVGTGPLSAPWQASEF